MWGSSASEGYGSGLWGMGMAGPFLSRLLPGRSSRPDVTPLPWGRQRGARSNRTAGPDPMWQHYSKTIVVVQLFIIALCTAMKFLLGMPWLAVGVLFLVMQPGAL